MLLALALAVGLIAGLLTGLAAEQASGPVTGPVRNPQIYVVNMLRQRFETLMDGDLSRIEWNYLVDELGGEYAWIKEQNRTRYFRAWLEDRGYTLKSARAWFEVDSVISLGRGGYRMEITEHAAYEYSHPTGEGTAKTHAFGSRTVHVLEAHAVGDGWRIAYDWYADPLGEGAITPGKGRIVPSASETQPGPTDRVPDEPDSFAQTDRYDRERAADYALRHSGVRSMPGGGKYNRDYDVYSYVGGDCANFVSQVLAAGGLPQDWGWGYYGGSPSWTCSQDLVWYLLGSGTGRSVFRGDFAGALLPLPDEPRGAVGLLQPGDVIGYEIRGELTHVAVVAAVDPCGWPVIASHTADRLFFPWDLGWDQDTVFWFVQIVY